MMKALISPRKRIALVAHDKKKKDLVEWASFNQEILKQHELTATGTTGKLLEKELDVPVNKLLSGPLGGDQQLGAMIAEGKIDIIIFFWDPLETQPHESDVKALIRLAVTWNIILVCNRTTADFVITSKLMEEKYDRTTPDYSHYTNRDIK